MLSAGVVPECARQVETHDDETGRQGVLGQDESRRGSGVGGAIRGRRRRGAAPAAAQSPARLPLALLPLGAGGLLPLHQGGKPIRIAAFLTVLLSWISFSNRILEVCCFYG